MKRLIAYELSGRLGLSTVFLAGVRRFPAKWLTVLAYHRICEYEADSPWDPDVISATPDAFRKQLAFINAHFIPVTSEQIVLWKKGCFTMPRNPIVLTFDDGYLDNYSVALPLLLEAGAVGDFFVCPWYVENRRLFWWDKIAYCLQRTRRQSITLTYPKRVELKVGSPESSQAARRTVLGIVKLDPKLDIETFMYELQEKSEVRLDEQEAADRLLMRWKHIRALHQAGMGVGSHTHTHPILSPASEESAREELARSKAVLEKKLNGSVCALAYPVGSFAAKTKTLAQRLGYEIAYSYCSGASFLRTMDMFDVRRVAVEKHMSLPYFRTLLAAPFVA